MALTFQYKCRYFGPTLAVLIWLTLTISQSIGADSSVPNVLQGPFKGAGTKDPTPAQTLDRTTVKMRSAFDSWLEQPTAYHERALSECSVFPEGKTYPYALPAMAYANLALTSSTETKHAANQMRKLIGLLIESTTRAIQPPEGNLKKLRTYGDQGTYLATLNYVLGNYALISNDGRYRELQVHLSGLLYQALESREGQPIASYPEYTWYFDTLMAIGSLQLYDQDSARVTSLLNKHLQWRREYATDRTTRLPIAYTNGLPRGCDLSMQVCLLAQMDSRATRELYTDYCAHHWLDYGIASGFSEWPKGSSISTADIDSGPIVFGMGMTATGVGIGSTRAIGDAPRLAKLTRQLDILPEMLKLARQADPNGTNSIAGMPASKPEYLTGFLYGDAVLFYSVTWTAYPKTKTK